MDLKVLNMAEDVGAAFKKRAIQMFPMKQRLLMVMLLKTTQIIRTEFYSEDSTPKILLLKILMILRGCELCLCDLSHVKMESMQMD